MDCTIHIGAVVLYIKTQLLINFFSKNFFLTLLFLKNTDDFKTHTF